MRFSTIDEIFNIALIAGNFGLDIATENVTFKPMDGSAYLAAFRLPLPVTQATLGDNGEDLHSGIYQININYPQDSGMTVLYDKADAINLVFKSGATFTSGTTKVRIKNVSVERVIVSGGFATLPLTIEYYTFLERL